MGLDLFWGHGYKFMHDWQKAYWITIRTSVLETVSVFNEVFASISLSARRQGSICTQLNVTLAGCRDVPKLVLDTSVVLEF